MEIDEVAPPVGIKSQAPVSSKPLPAPKATSPAPTKEAVSKVHKEALNPPPVKKRSRIVREMPPPSMAQIRSLVDGGQWQEAEEKLLKLLSKNPEDEEILLELAMIQIIDNKDPDAAKPYLERALAVNVQNETVLGELISIYEETESLGEGIEFLKSLAAEGQTSGPLSFGIGTSLLNVGRAEEAIDYLERASEQGGVQAGLVTEDLADAYLAARRIEDANALFTDLIEQGATHEDLKGFTLKIAFAHLENGDRGRAEEVLESWLKRHPDDLTAKNILKDFRDL